MARTSSESKSKTVKSIPSSETGQRVTCYTKDNDKYIISHNPLKMQFTLWKCIEDSFEKISTSNNPLNFDKIIFNKK